MYKFENQLPKTTSYKKDNGIFYIKNRSFNMTLDEARACGELNIEAINDKATKAVVLDNREARGAYKQEILELWENMNLGKLINGGHKKFVTLTNSALAAMQTNRLAKRTGSDSMSKAFFSDFNDEVRAFIDAK